MQTRRMRKSTNFFLYIMRLECKLWIKMQLLFDSLFICLYQEQWQFEIGKQFIEGFSLLYWNNRIWMHFSSALSCIYCSSLSFAEEKLSNKLSVHTRIDSKVLTHGIVSPKPRYRYKINLILAMCGTVTL